MAEKHTVSFNLRFACILGILGAFIGVIIGYQVHGLSWWILAYYSGFGMIGLLCGSVAIYIENTVIEERQTKKLIVKARTH